MQTSALDKCNMSKNFCTFDDMKANYWQYCTIKTHKVTYHLIVKAKHMQTYTEIFYVTLPGLCVSPSLFSVDLFLPFCVLCFVWPLSRDWWVYIARTSPNTPAFPIWSLIAPACLPPSSFSYILQFEHDT